jgi:hypothetical protein
VRRRQTAQLNDDNWRVLVPAIKCPKSGELVPATTILNGEGVTLCPGCVQWVYVEDLTFVEHTARAA